MATSGNIHTPSPSLSAEMTDSVTRRSLTPPVLARLYRAGQIFDDWETLPPPRASEAASAGVSSASPPSVVGANETVTPASSPVSPALTVPLMMVDVGRRVLPGTSFAPPAAPSAPAAAPPAPASPSAPGG